VLAGRVDPPRGPGGALTAQSRAITRLTSDGPSENLAHMSFIAACYQSARTHACVNPKELLA
jgi:hypothetical protein